jgi:hypothetical protein
MPEGGDCDFFQSYDPPTCLQSALVILGLLKRLRSIEAKNERLKK